MKHIAVVGAGPIGLEAALYGLRLGHDVQVYERGLVADHVRRWGHVTLFSPWSMNHSILGARALLDEGVALPPPESLLTGAEHVARYLEPLSRSTPLRGRVQEGHAVVRVGRSGIGKSDLIGGSRNRHPFRLLLESAESESIAGADVVIDCSGTFQNPNWMGNGNIPAPGERECRGDIAYHLEDIEGSARDNYEGRRVLVVGDGFSAATALDALSRLSGTRVLWLTRRRGPAPLCAVPDDPLPGRARLSALANGLARGDDPRVEFLGGATLERVERAPDGFEITLAVPDGRERTETVERILALVGYAPDATLYRQLQIHECYATAGPMKLAAGLLSGESADCLTQTSDGPDALRNPEPDFYILGAKSYGTNTSFLIRVGLEQVRDVYTLIERRPELDLYAA